MRSIANYFLVVCMVVTPAIAQFGRGGFRGGTGFRERGFVRPRLPGYPGPLGYRVRPGLFPRNRFIGFGIPAYWPSFGGPDYPDYSSGWGYRDYNNIDQDLDNSFPSVTYGDLAACPAQQSPPKIMEYRGPAHACTQVNGKIPYRIAIGDQRTQSAYQKNIWVTQDYSYAEGNLIFKTLQGEEKKTPIRSIDRALTLQLNRNCGLSFQLPQ